MKVLIFFLKSSVGYKSSNIFLKKQRSLQKLQIKFLQTNLVCKSSNKFILRWKRMRESKLFIYNGIL